MVKTLYSVWRLYYFGLRKIIFNSSDCVTINFRLRSCCTKNSEHKIRSGYTDLRSDQFCTTLNSTFYTSLIHRFLLKIRLILLKRFQDFMDQIIYIVLHNYNLHIYNYIFTIFTSILHMYIFTMMSSPSDL